jgi:hypothetical protein
MNYPFATDEQRCPKCGAGLDNMIEDSRSYESGSIYLEMRCAECDLEWTEAFDFSRRFMVTDAGVVYIHES